MFTGGQIVSLLRGAGITHVVTVPDSTLGQWEVAIEASGIELIRVCREGEAWAVAGGLYLGGAAPLVMIQCTGLFESGDALRIPSIIGYRSYLNQEILPGDTCLVFTEPVLRTWQIDYRLITDPVQYPEMARHLEECRTAGTPGALLIAEGRA
jgi:sulfopyruvate decarboxylase subunit alpha